MGVQVGFRNVFEKNKGFLVMVVVELAFAGMAMFSKAVIDNGMSPYVFVVYRLAFATITLAPFAFFLDKEKAGPMSYTLILKIFFLSLFGITTSSNLHSYSIKYVSATFSSATINTIPALTFLIAIIFRMETFSIRDFVGIAKVVGSMVSLSGAMVFAFVKGPGLKWPCSTNEPIPTTHLITSKENWVQGCILMLAANIIWACWLVLQGPLVKEYPAKFRVAMLQCFFSCAQSSILAITIQKDVSLWRLKWDSNLFSVAYCGIVVSGICYWLQLWVVEKKGPLFAASFTPLILIFTAILSALFWKETLFLGSFVGGLLLMAGLYCVIWGKNRETQNQEIQLNMEAKEETIV